MPGKLLELNCKAQVAAMNMPYCLSPFTSLCFIFCEEFPGVEITVYFAPRFINPQFWGQSQPQLRCDLDGMHTKPTTLACKFKMVGDPLWK